jgi:hypothetical protein
VSQCRVQSRLYRKTLKCQSRETVGNVMKFRQKDDDEHKCIIPVSKVHERVASATGVSKSSITIKNEMLNLQAGATTSYSTPKIHKTRLRPCTNLDDFDMCVVRRTIHQFYIHEKRVVKAVLMKLRETIGYKGQASSELKIFKALGFRWRKMRDNRRILIEKQDVRSACVAFLRAVTRFRRDGRAIVYSDETCIHSFHTTNTGGLIIYPGDTWR